VTDEAVIRKLCEAVARLEGRDALLERELQILADQVKDMGKSLYWIRICIIILTVEAISGEFMTKLLPLIKGLV
jgi:hypothetical protein